MALQDILAAIEDEARAEAVRIEAEAAAQAASLLASSGAESEAAAAAEIARARAASSHRRLRRERRAEAAARARMREAREACVVDALAAARARLDALHAGPRWPEAWRALLEEAVAMVGGARRVIADAGDFAHAPTTCASFVLEPAREPLQGVVVTDDAGRSARNTLPSRFRAAEPLLRAVAQETLETSWTRRTMETPASAR
jgi:vacuolar-type H+-ATPase subunit E/Vma4